jgi:hypothetical protein
LLSSITAINVPLGSNDVGERLRSLNGFFCLLGLRIDGLHRLVAIRADGAIACLIICRWTRCHRRSPHSICTLNTGHNHDRNAQGRQVPPRAMAASSQARQRPSTTGHNRCSAPLTAVSKCSNVRQRNCGYSITSSRRASWDGGTGNSERLRRLHGNCQLVLGWCLDRKIQPQNPTGTAPPSTRAQSGERTGGTVARAAKRRCASGCLSCCR